MRISNPDIITRLKQDDQQALKYLFDLHYKELLIYAIKHVISREIAEEIVQDVFVQIWENRKKTVITKSLKAYLYTSVKNSSLNYLKSKYAKMQFVEIEDSNLKKDHHTVEDNITAEELKVVVRIAVQNLPDKCRIIYNLSRNAGLTNTEIAKKLNLSKQAVSTQISIAIEKIKDALRDQWDNIPS